MSQKNTEYRSARGKRLEGHSLVVRMSQEIVNSVLSKAYVMVKAIGVQFHVSKLDGVSVNSHIEKDVVTINVIVIDGIIMKSWVSMS